VKMDYASERAAAIRAVELASVVCATVFDSLNRESQVNTKPDQSPVTIADYAAQAIIIDALKDQFPDIAFIAEEDSTMLRLPSSTSMCDAILSLVHKVKKMSLEDILDNVDRGSSEGGPQGKYWVLDPIDGTKGFVGGRQYALCLGLVVDGVAVMGVLGCPNYCPSGSVVQSIDGSNADKKHGSLFVAVVGQGAFLRRLRLILSDTEYSRISGSEHEPKGKTVSITTDNNIDEQPISVSTTNDFGDAVFCESVESGHTSHSLSASVAEKLNIVNPPTRMDSQCKYASVACGSMSGVDAYLRPPPSSMAGRHENTWDHAAGCVIVSEAGGRVTDLLGQPLDFSCGRLLRNNVGVVCSNSVLHDRIIGATATTFSLSVST
jgi:3'(2'), 5'-bisphosphate nucleotidase